MIARMALMPSRVRRSVTAASLGVMGCILGTLAACSSVSPPPTAAPAVQASAAAGSAGAASSGAIRITARGRWVAAAWSDLPGWDGDGVIHAWPALLRSCDKPSPAWAATCKDARALGAGADETQVRAFLRARLQPWRVESADGASQGLLTGYFEPLIEGSRRRTGKYVVPLMSPPVDLAVRKPWYSRSQIETLPEARAALKGHEIAWVADPLDALLLQIQGSGRLALDDGGQRRVVRLAFAGHNDQPYRSIGRWLVDQGALSVEQANWPAIKDWARANPQRVDELLHVNPRYVFFREEPLPDPTVGPVGGQGVPLTPGRSIAVDKESIPYGTPVWIDSTEPPARTAPPGTPGRALQRLVVAQDTGNAISGAVRADYFWGWGEGAEERAGRMKQPLRMWVLWPAQ